MDKTTFLLTISREDFIDEFITSIELIECDTNKIKLLAIVDGGPDLYLKIRNRLVTTKYNNVLTVQYISKEQRLQYDVLSRRRRISDIHNFAKKYVEDTEYVLILEDDTIIPQNAYIKLHRHYLNNPFSGFIQGIEKGRWGIEYLGAWKINDIYNPTEITSLDLLEGLQEVDNGGFYCTMTKSEYYINHDFKPFDNNSLGPDADYGISLRQLGVVNYTDFSIKCIHKSADKDYIVNNNYDIVKFTKNDNGRWRQTHVQ